MKVAMAYNVWETCLLVPGFNREECASWVQALGSIGALLAVFFIAHRESKERTKQARDANAAKISYVSQLTAHAAGVAGELERRLEQWPPGARLSLDVRDVEAAAEMLSRALNHETPPVALMPLMLAYRALSRMTTVAQSIHGRPWDENSGVTHSIRFDANRAVQAMKIASDLIPAAWQHVVPPTDEAA